jgi:hypothetical protein
MDLPYWEGQAFLLLVESPTEDGIHQPKEGDLCSIRLVGVQRRIPKPQGNKALTADELEKLVADLSALSIDANGTTEDEETGYIRERLGSHSLPGGVTDERIELLKRKRGEKPAQLKKRILELVKSWTKEAGLHDTVAESWSEEAGLYDMSLASISLVQSSCRSWTVRQSISPLPRSRTRIT